MWRRILIAIGIGGMAVGLGACTWLFLAPKAVLKAVPQMGEAPLEVTFDLSGSSGNIVSYTLNFGDTASTSGTDITAPVVHTYGDPGDYVATLTVQDARGRTDSDSVTIKVQYPLLQAVLDVSVQTPPYTFAFDASGSQGYIETYTLDFGDGTAVGGDWATATWPVYHTYAQTGSYVATLWIEDSYGQHDWDSVIVEVGP